MQNISSKTIKLFKILKEISGYKFFYLTLLMFFLAGMELFSVGLLLPILNSFFDDSLFLFFQENNFFVFEKINSKENFNLVLLLILILAYFFKFILYIFFNFLQNYYVMDVYYKTSKIILRRYLNEDYFFYIKNNTSILIKNLKEEVRLFIFGVLMQTAIFILEIFVLILFLIFLLWFNFKVTISILILFIIVVSVYILTVRTNIKKLGKYRFNYEQKYLNEIIESFSFIKDIKLLSLEKYFLDSSLKSLKTYTNSQRSFNILQVFPRQIIEISSITFFISFLIIATLNGIEITSLFVTLGVYGASAMRLMPMFSRIVSSYQQISFNHKTVDTIYKEIKKVRQKTSLKNKNKITKFKLIKFENVNFKYPNSKNKILNSSNIEIKKGEKIAIVGESGIGKSTIADILTGLIKPNSGKIKIDNKNIVNNSEMFRDITSYSQQNVCLLNSTIIKNIVLDNKINVEKLRKVSKVAMLEKLIFDKSRSKNLVGESGKKLSGGQKQRISIARALYRDPEILILDESTNALDKKNEKNFYKNLKKYYPKLTLIIITHNLQMLSNCDKVYELKKGKLNRIKKNS